MTPKARAQEALDSLRTCWQWKREKMDDKAVLKLDKDLCYELIIDHEDVIREALEKHAAAVKRGEA